MPEIDLGPNNYRKQVNGRWHLPDDPKLCRNMFCVAVAIVLGLSFYRSASVGFSEFWLPVMFAFGAGIMFAIWKRDVY